MVLHVEVANSDHITSPVCAPALTISISEEPFIILLLRLGTWIL
jgi:hypothetical protein